MNFADNLKRIRKENNLSQEQLAEELGVSRQSVSKWESGQAYPEMDKILKLCNMFNLSIDDLINENISAVNEQKKEKRNFNKNVNYFIDSIIKIINLFVSMDRKSRIKCILEQIIIAFVIFIFFFGVALILDYILFHIFGIFYYHFSNTLEGIYCIFSLIIGIAFLFLMFKKRYLDYFKFETKSDEVYVDNKERKSITFERKEPKIIFRDPENSGYNFYKSVSKFFIRIFKAFAFAAMILTCLIILGCTTAAVASFMISKAGLLFVGILITLISSVGLFSIITIFLYGFIFNRKIKKKIPAIIALCLIISIGAGIGTSFVGISSFESIDCSKISIEDKTKYKSEEFKINYTADNLEIREYGIFEIKYVPVSSDKISVKVYHPLFEKVEMSEYSEDNKNVCCFETQADNLNSLKFLLNSINDKKIYNNQNSYIFIYTSQKNIDKLKMNRT